MMNSTSNCDFKSHILEFVMLCLKKKKKKTCGTHLSAPSPKFFPVGRAQHIELTDSGTVPYSCWSGLGGVDSYSISTTACAVIAICDIFNGLYIKIPVEF